MGLVYAVAVKEGDKGYDMWNKTSVHKKTGNETSVYWELHKKKLLHTKSFIVEMSVCQI